VTFTVAETFDLAVVPPEVREVCNRLRSAGKKAWVVGGCVRDTLIGRVPGDWDVCTDAVPDDMLRIFPRAIPTGIQHGTVTVVVRRPGQEAAHVEVTTLRGETTYTDGRRPDGVFFVDDIVADLARRDFTINAIAVDAETGTLVDPFQGRKDLTEKTIRAVGVAEERFSEDGLRVLRAARFAAQLDFVVEATTRQAIGRTLDTYRKVSAERVREEWLKSMKAKTPSIAFDLMRETGILSVTCPELLDGVGCEQNRYHTYDVWGHALGCMDACVGDPILRLSALFHDVGKPKTRNRHPEHGDYTFYNHEIVGAEIVEPILQRLKFSTDETTRIKHLVRQHMWHYDGWSDATVRRWIRRVGVEAIDDLYRLREADIRGKGPEKIDAGDFESLEALRVHAARILAEGTALTIKDLSLNGRDLMQELQLKPGRILGEILEHLLERVTDDPARNEREVLLAEARVFVAEKVV
jgi:tRNA nucleotidyltransferase (CCA-adding enzyme)